MRPLTVALSVNITLDQRNLQFPNGNKFSIVLNSENANVPTIKLDMNDYGLYDGAHELIVDVYVNTGDNSKILSATKASYFYFHTLTQQTTTEVQQVNNDVTINDASLFSTSKTVQIVYPQVRSSLTYLLTYSLTRLFLTHRIAVLSTPTNSSFYLLFHHSMNLKIIILC